MRKNFRLLLMLCMLLTMTSCKKTPDTAEMSSAYSSAAMTEPSDQIVGRWISSEGGETIFYSNGLLSAGGFICRWEIAEDDPNLLKIFTPNTYLTDYGLDMYTNHFGYEEVFFEFENGNLKINDSVTERSSLGFVDQKDTKEFPGNWNIPESVYYGSYEQDSIQENGPERIEWIVLGQNESQMFLMSRYILDVQTYDPYYDNVWDASDIREWLNYDFYNAAFSEKEKNTLSKFISPYVSNKSSSSGDYVCLPSYMNWWQLCDQGFEIYGRTAYAEEKDIERNGEELADKYSDFWWLGDDGGSGCVQCADMDKKYYSALPVATLGIRPVIVVDVNAVSTK